MPERRPQVPLISSQRSTGVRRNLFSHHLSRRPTTASTSTSAETLRLDSELGEDVSDLVVRDKNGEFEVMDAGLQNGEDDEDLQDPRARLRDDESERQRLAAAVRDHNLERGRRTSEPGELVEQVKTVLRMNISRLADDNWMFEKEDEPIHGR